MMSRFLKGGDIPAADQATALLVGRIRAIAAEGRLAVSIEVGADHVWASANAASMLFVTAQQRKASPPDPTVIDELRQRTLQVILKPKQKD